MDDEFPYRITSFSETREIHESKKAWLKTQGINFGDYGLLKCDLATTDYHEYWRGLRFYWCFKDPETMTAFKLKWGNE